MSARTAGNSLVKLEVEPGPTGELEVELGVQNSFCPASSGENTTRTCSNRIQLLDPSEYQNIFASSDEEEIYGLNEVNEAIDCGPPLKCVAPLQRSWKGNLKRAKKRKRVVAMVQSKKRTERTIVSKYLSGDSPAFRLSVPSDCIFHDDLVWRQMKCDLRIIGYLTEPGGHVEVLPFCCTEQSAHISSLKTLIGVLPPLYSARLIILRMVGHCFRRESPNLVNEAIIVEQVKRCFLELVQTPPTERPVYEEINTGTKMLRPKIRLSGYGQTLFNVKVWQPTMFEELIPSVRKTLSSNNLKHGLSLLSKEMVLKEKDLQYFDISITPVIKFAPGLSAFAWSNDARSSIAKTRLMVSQMLCQNLILCSLFSLKQLWGCGQVFEDQCSVFGRHLAILKESLKVRRVEEAVVCKSISAAPVTMKKQSCSERLAEKHITFFALAIELHVDILSFLDASSLYKCCLVSRSWFKRADTNWLWDALDGLYDYNTCQSLLNGSQGRQDYNCRHMILTSRNMPKRMVERYHFKLQKEERSEIYEQSKSPLALSVSLQKKSRTFFSWHWFDRMKVRFSRLQVRLDMKI